MVNNDRDDLERRVERLESKAKAEDSSSRTGAEIAALLAVGFITQQIVTRMFDSYRHHRTLLAREKRIQRLKVVPEHQLDAIDQKELADLEKQRELAAAYLEKHTWIGKIVETFFPKK